MYSSFAAQGFNSTATHKHGTSASAAVSAAYTTAAAAAVTNKQQLGVQCLL
jgi:hypothetical protein